MYCTSCGKQVPDSTKFCPYCGTRLAVRGATNSNPTPVLAGSSSESTAPFDGLDEPDAPGAVDGTADAVAPKKKRRWPFVVAAVPVVAVLVAVALLFLANWDDAGSAEDEEASVTGTYYSDESIPVVFDSTTIVFYDDEGEELEEYDLYLMDGAGELTHCHVDAEGGRFSAGAYGVELGTYRMIVREPETNTVHTVDRIIVADDEDGATDSDDGVDYVRYEDELVIKPDPDDADSDSGSGSDSDSGSTASARQAAYALYYERVLELQELYGEAALDSAGECLSGLAFVGLAELSGDDDGIEELVLIYNNGGEAYGSWTIEIWRYDAEANEIVLVCEEPFGGTDDAQMVVFYDYGETVQVAWSYWTWEDPIATFTSYAVRLDGDSLVVLEATYTVDYDTDEVSYLVDGEETDQASYSVYCGAMIDSDQLYFTNYCVTVYSAEEWATYSGDLYAYYDPTDTLAYTQATIEALQLGMMGLTEDELWGDTDAADDLSDLERYAEVLDAIYDGIESGWDGYDYDTAPISYLWWFSYASGLEIDSLGEAGYTFVDLDGDGVNELVTAVFQGTGWFSYPYDMYTYVDGEVVHLEEEAERYGFTLLEDGLIYEWGSGGASTSYYGIYELVDGELQLVEAVNFDSDADADNPWFYSTTTTTTSQMDSISQDEANAIMDAWFEDHGELELTYTYFTDYER